MKTYTIRFRGGDTTSLNEAEYKRLINRFNTSNRNFPRFFCDNGEILMIENITRVIPVESDEPKVSGPCGPDCDCNHEILEPLGKMDLTEEMTEGVITQELTNEQRQKEMLEEIMRKSSCTHDCEQILFKTDTKQGVRYFRLCSFCGGNRTRFIAAKNLTDDEMNAAETWEEKV